MLALVVFIFGAINLWITYQIWRRGQPQFAIVAAVCWITMLSVDGFVGGLAALLGMCIIGLSEHARLKHEQQHGSALPKIGEAPGKTPDRPLTESEQAEALGPDPFKPAYELVFSRLKAVYARGERVDHELVSIAFKAGQPMGLESTVVPDKRDAPLLRSTILNYAPLVAEVFEASVAPNNGSGQRTQSTCSKVIQVSMHVRGQMAIALCELEDDHKTLNKAELMFPTLSPRSEAQAGKVNHA